MDSLRYWITGEKKRPLYPFEIGQDMRFGGRRFEPVAGSVAFFDQRNNAVAHKNGRVRLDFTVEPGITDPVFLQGLFPDNPKDTGQEERRRRLSQFGATYTIFVDPQETYHAVTGYSGPKENVWVLRHFNGTFDADAILKSFKPYGFSKPKKREEKGLGWQLGEVFLPAPEGRV